MPLNLFNTCLSLLHLEHIPRMWVHPYQARTTLIWGSGTICQGGPFQDRGDRGIFLRLLALETGQPGFGPNFLGFVFFICKMPPKTLQDPPWYGFPASFPVTLIICALIIPQVKHGLFAASSLCTCPFFLLEAPLGVPAQAACPYSSDPSVCISQDRMGYATVTGNPPVSVAWHSPLLLATAAWWTLSVVVTLGPTLMGAPSPLVLQRTGTNVLEATLASNAPAPRWPPSFLLTLTNVSHGTTPNLRGEGENAFLLGKLRTRTLVSRPKGSRIWGLFLQEPLPSLWCVPELGRLLLSQWSCLSVPVTSLPTPHPARPF